MGGDSLFLVGSQREKVCAVVWDAARSRVAHVVFLTSILCVFGRGRVLQEVFGRKKVLSNRSPK